MLANERAAKKPPFLVAHPNRPVKPATRAIPIQLTLIRESLRATRATYAASFRRIGDTKHVPIQVVRHECVS
jgi:hypothetical protein